MLLVVYVVSQVASTYFVSATVQRSQRILLMVLPVFFVPVITRFPVGLLLYWVTTNLWTVGQGIVTRRMVPKPAAAAEALARGRRRRRAPAPQRTRRRSRRRSRRTAAAVRSRPRRAA